MIKIKSFVATDKGMVRENNEDNFYMNGRYMTEEERENSLNFSVESSKHNQTFAVCDGMGGAAMGEIASYIAVKGLRNLDGDLEKDELSSLEYKAKAINSYVNMANTEICKVMQNQARERMGSTLSGLHIFEDKAVTFNIGDSRVYIFRDNQLKQLTLDHTEAQRLVRLGVIDEEQAKHHKSKHQLTRHFGILPSEGILEADISSEFEIKEDDILLLCSDGLTDMLPDINIKEILTQTQSIDEVHTNLVKEALRMGGHDNVTVIIIKVF